MLRKVLFFAMAVTISSPQLSSAAELKIGFVNSVKLFSSAPQAKAASENLLKEFEPRQKELQERQSKLRDEEERFIKDSAMMSAPQRQKKERELIGLQRELKLDETSFKEDVAIRRSAEMEAVQETLRQTIQSYGANNGYDLILFEGVSYASDRVDITDKIISILEKK